MKKQFKIFTIALLFMGFLFGCADKPAPTVSNNGNPGNVNTQPQSGTIPQQIVYAGTVYYTGYEPSGSVDLSLLIPTRRKIEVIDPTIAIVERENLEVPADVVEQRITQLEELFPGMSARTVDRWRQRLTNPSIWRITPLKPGITGIKATRISSRTGAERWESVWEKPEIRTLVVKPYSAAQIEMGRQRYEAQFNAGIGQMQACSNCHTGQVDVFGTAPPHEIGNVVEISDDDAVTWISSGSVKDRVASQNALGHNWQFSSTEEAFAVVAYLRSKQTGNADDLARLLFESDIEDIKADN